MELRLDDMKRLILFLAIALLTASASFAQKDWAGFGRYAEDNKTVTVRPKAVFFGDSITDAWGRNSSGFFVSNNFVGRGISGQTTSEMLVRLRADVLELHPKYMVLLAGINDIAMNNGKISVEQTFGNIVSMVELCKLYKIKPVLCTVFPTTDIPWRKEVPDVSARIGELNTLIRDYARKHHIKCVDYFPPECYTDGRLNPEFSKDGVHPNGQGYTIMQETILKVLK